ncbi:DUF459 domain-containing protein, partial [Sandarakinorhabdus sp.]|uniref:SGNH/GDSL hydrolase family protein n=1 Tax=Sandarakinorhabdus sp. TaxID=1916663 RepID=UPI003340FDA6
MSQHPALVFIDRTAVLFCGVAAGIAIGLAFAPQISGQISALVGDGPAGLQSDVPDDFLAAPAPGTSPGGPALPASVANAGRVPAGLARAVAAGRPFRIGVFGDSFGDGLWAALYNQLPRREAFQVLRYSQQATGFTRYRQTNLQDQLAGQLAQGPVDVAVISYGANDVQGLFVDGRVAPLLSPRWQGEVTARITRYVETLRAQGAAVVWVGLPVMRDARFDEQIQGLNRFHARVMAQLGVPFIDTRGAAVGADGGYASHLPDPRTGAPWLVRAGDGIHMSMKGYRLLTDTLAARLRAWGQAARGGSAVLPQQVPPVPSAVPPVPSAVP